MNTDSEVEEKEFPLRKKAVLRLRKGKEIPVVVSCRSDGDCVILPQSMRDIIFPKLIESEKAKKGGD